MPTNRRPNPAEERAARQARRLRAAELFAQGHTQAEVARQLGVSRQAASITSRATVAWAGLSIEWSEVQAKGGG